MRGIGSIKLIFVLFLLIPCSQASAQDICRDEFVACVQKTGDSFACRSVYTNCQLNQGNDLLLQTQESETDTNSEALDFRPEITEVYGGFDGIQLWVTNSSANAVQIGNMTYEVSCADGSRDRAVFFIDGIIEGDTKNRRIGSAQVVCANAGGAVALVDSQNTGEAQGLASVAAKLRFEYPCANDQYKWIELTYHQPGNFYRWKNSAGYRGVINEGFIYEKQFASLACEPLSPPSSSYINEAARMLNEWFSSPEGEQEIKYKHSVNPGGVRG